MARRATSPWHVACSWEAMDRKRWSSVLAALGVASGAGIFVGVSLGARLARFARLALVLRVLDLETAENERRLATAS
ncbi:MAG TPA: hypothetical protein VGH28_21710 [Polyangiaceae bacterium]